MTKRIFVCHAKSDIEPTSETVDNLENALDLPDSVLLTSSLPGYSSDTRSEDELRAMLASTTVVLALMTEASAEDPEFSFELGAAWALGIDVIPLLRGSTDASALPWPIRSCPSIRPTDAADWDRLLEDLSLRLDVPRLSGATPTALAMPPAPVPASEPFVVSSAESQRDTFDLDAERAPAFTLDPPDSPGAFDDAEAERTPPFTFDPERRAAFALAPEPEHTPVFTFDPERRSVFDPEPEPGPTANGYLSPAQAAVAELLSSPPSAPVSEPPMANSDVFARLPSCEMSLEAGRAVSDCVFNRAEINDFESELSVPLGRFVDAMGGSWSELRKLQDLELWLGATENLLGSLPPELHRCEEWYQVGFELATLHNLAGQLVLDGPERDERAEQQWRQALDRFLSRAERANIGYEDLGRVLPLLENLAGPRAERDLTNIGRSLNEVRSYAVGADRIHTAA